MRVALDNVKVLHDHQRIHAHTCCHINRNHTVANIAFIGFWYDCAFRVHLCHALHDLELFHYLSDRVSANSAACFAWVICSSVV